MRVAHGRGGYWEISPRARGNIPSDKSCSQGHYPRANLRHREPAAWTGEIASMPGCLTWASTMPELCRLAGVNPSSLRDIRAGRVPSLERAQKIASAVGYSLDELYSSATREVGSIFVQGTTSGGEVFSEFAGLGRHFEVDLLQPNSVFVEVSGDELLPSFRRGDVIGGTRFTGANLDNLIGLECLVAERGGAGRWVKVLARGGKPGRYDLRSLRPGQPDLTNVAIEWAAPIRWVLRNV